MSKQNKQCPEFPFFGASYPDARCIDGYLFDLDKCDENGKIVLRWLDVEKSKNMQLMFQIDSLGNLLAKATTAPDTVFLPSKEILIEKNTPVPYPVEKELGWWQQTKINYGGWAIVVIIITILIVFGKMIYKLKK